MYHVLKFVMNAGFRAAGYRGVRSTPGILISSARQEYKLLVKVCYAINKRVYFTKHDWDVREEEDQVDQITLAFPD